MRFSAFKLFLFLLCAVTVSAPADAKTAIKVVVNDQAITSYDIQQRARLITLTQRKSGSIARRMAEEELINEVIQLEEAKRIGVMPSQQQVDNAYANIARNVKMTPSKLSSALRRGGVKPETLKNRLKTQIAWQSTLRARFRSEIKIEESEVIAALRKSDKKDISKSVEYNLSQIIVVVPKKASGSFKSKRQRESNAIRKAFQSCDNAGAVLGQYSEVVLKTIGRRLETELPENVKKDIIASDVGRLTKPLKTGRGYEMIAVCGKREMESDIAARTEMENELRAKEGQKMSRRYLRELKRRATIVHR